jgi:hypothetical protein
MGRLAAQLAKVAGGLQQAFAKVPLPQAIHRDAREERIFRRREPVSERLDAAIPKIHLGVGKRPAGLDLMVFLGP